MTLSFEADGQTWTLDEEVWALMKKEAEVFVDTPNTVLRRKYGLPVARNGAGPAAELRGAAAGSSRAATRRQGTRRGASTSPRGSRAPKGSLLPQAEYEGPILQVLHERDGEAPAREAVDALEPILADRLGELDRALTAKSGEVRWRNRAQFARLALVKQGLIDSDAPRGIWRLTEAGRKAAAVS